MSTELTLCKQLDELEDKMPPLVANYMRVNRAIYTRTTREMSRIGNLAWDSAGAIVNAAGTGVKTVTGQARYAADRTTAMAETGVKTVTGQARSAAERTASTASTGAKRTVGQAKAQSKRAVDNASAELEDLADDIKADRKAPAANELSSMTKAELYDRAQDMDIDGRSSMTKAELIAAIRKS